MVPWAWAETASKLRIEATKKDFDIAAKPRAKITPISDPQILTTSK
jgi:hypothetical protein